MFLFLNFVSGLDATQVLITRSLLALVVNCKRSELRATNKLTLDNMKRRLQEISWEDVKWIFVPSGMTLDIYVKNTILADWKNVMTLLNENYALKFHLKQKELNLIDIDYMLDYLKVATAEAEYGSVEILNETFKIYCSFFDKSEIEFHFWPEDIKFQSDLETVLNFMNSISRTLVKPIFLTFENMGDSPPLIEIDHTQNFCIIASESDWQMPR